MTAPYYSDESVTLYHGDCLSALGADELGYDYALGYGTRHAFPDNSVDAIVTDPPYGLEFMGKEWDGADGFRRSLNPADAGRESVFGRTSRTSPEYRTASKAAAGMSGTGYTDGGERLERPSFLGGLNPKCLACGKWQRGGNPCACDTPDFTNERLPRLHTFQAWCEAWARECLRVLKPGGWLLSFGGSRTAHRLTCGIEDAGFEIRDGMPWIYGTGFPKSRNLDGEWQGWGTALKPGHEPITVARKPLIGTVAANVERFGTGALNIDGCRVAHASPGDLATLQAKNPGRSEAVTSTVYGAGRPQQSVNTAGRWPTNVLLDGTAADDLDQQTRTTRSRIGKPRGADSGEGWGMTATGAEYDDSGGASRFFPTFRYEAKAPTAERPRHGDVAHPTVKPLDLMRWLVRLVTPPGGTVLEPFAGSGTTAEACVIEGFRCIAIEREAAYLPLIVARLSKPIQPDLFGGVA